MGTPCNIWMTFLFIIFLFLFSFPFILSAKTTHQKAKKKKFADLKKKGG